MFNGLLSAPFFAVSWDLAETLQYADMSVISNIECMDTFDYLITDSKICVSTADKKALAM